MNSLLHFFTDKEIESFYSLRKGEEKFGEHILYAKNEEDLSHFSGKFVLLGIPEDIGIRANLGIGGAYSAFDSFLKSFLNIQQSGQLNGKQFLLLGKINTLSLMEKSQSADIYKLRRLTADLDEMVVPVIQKIVSLGKIPIVIGGGHNNSYPILKACSLSFHTPVNTINLDAHADFRTLEGRHSGNGFRYAYHEKFLNKYTLLGLHEAYNNEHILNELSTNPDFLPIFFEDIFISQKESWEASLERGIDFVNDRKFGVELDLDSLENVLSSAWSPVGIPINKSLNFLYTCGKEKNVCYVHLTEAVATRSDGTKNPLIGKLLNYMIQAFCKGVRDQYIQPSIH